VKTLHVKSGSKAELREFRRAFKNLVEEKSLPDYDIALDRAQSFDCDVYESLGDERPSHIIGYREGALIADVNLYEKRHGVLGRDKYYVWRSGIKHDCSKVMELEKEGVLFRNGAGEMVGLEEEYVYLLYKSSDISNGRLRCRKNEVRSVIPACARPPCACGRTPQEPLSAVLRPLAGLPLGVV